MSSVGCSGQQGIFDAYGEGGRHKRNGPRNVQALGFVTLIGGLGGSTARGAAKYKRYYSKFHVLVHARQPFDADVHPGFFQHFAPHAFL